MSFWVLAQVLVNLVLVAGVVGIWMRFQRPQKDDPRLSKGLQLLQSKIAVLEDLSDRTEVQVQQLTTLLEQKVREIQQQVQHSDKQLQKIEQSMQKSLEVAKIFQDRIPHSEIVERQSTIKYVKAARLAHQGMSVQEIASQVDLSLGEIEMIAKVNKDQLMFCEESLPEWAQSSTEPAIAKETDVDAFQESRIDMEAPLSREVPVDLTKAFEVPKADQEALKKLGDAFRQACETANHLQQVTQGFVEDNKVSKGTPAKASGPVIRPVTFPRIEG
ncbi:DUF2802 domain-containing protein [Bdellovibrio sp. HCB337]|uniref:DUF2802 domain-containing protein n=1 Tax=Bdellovibrio sp. HCB337 TaxID=3394358 RepID=UPI0039A4CE7C